MSACRAGAITDASGVADGLRLVDCMANAATEQAFGRLFGPGGYLLPVLTALLTLYVAVLGIGLLTGRARIGLSSLTPRMMTLGLVLTFATSWMAYQSVVWNLAVGAPDQIASLLLGTRGSATVAFAGRVDLLFQGIAEAANQIAGPPISGPGAAQMAASNAITASAPPNTLHTGTFTPTDLMWLSALALLLGTVGVLVTAKIALAVLLAVGPIFIVLALFGVTRGLFEGWCKAAIVFALVPLFTVLLGAGVLEAAGPVVAELRGPGGIDAHAVVTLFVIAAVYVALMVLAVKMATILVTGWHIGGDDEAPAAAASGMAASAAGGAGTTVVPLAAGGGAAGERTRAILAAMPMPANDGGTPGPAGHRRETRLVTQAAAPAAAAPAAVAAGGERARGLGSRFRPAPALPFKEKRP